MERGGGRGGNRGGSGGGGGGGSGGSGGGGGGVPWEDSAFVVLGRRLKRARLRLVNDGYQTGDLFWSLSPGPCSFFFLRLFDTC